MDGGTSGLKLEVCLSVMTPDVTGTDWVDRVYCQSWWAYEADLHSCDLILGYPFLKGFGLAIDSGANALTYSSVFLKERHAGFTDDVGVICSELLSNNSYQACVK